VAVVRARIAEGQTYQCNLTTRLTGPVRGELFGLYPDLGLESA
jgi:para-aminobenzoate synthetase/4-amino-4-deoxychorismate lyase